MIQVLERAFKILKIVSADPNGSARVSDLAKTLGINQSTCTNIIKTLVQGGYLEPESGSRSYVLGPEPFRLAQANTRYKRLIDSAQPHIQKLVERIDETCLLARLGRWQKVILCKVDRDSPFQLRMDYMEEQDPYTTATGRLLIAHLQQRERTQLVKSQGMPLERWNNIEDLAELETVCIQLRAEKCYFYGPEQSELIGIASSVTERGNVIAALGLFLPTARFTGQHKKEIIAGITETAKKISHEL